MKLSERIYWHRKYNAHPDDYEMLDGYAASAQQLEQKIHHLENKVSERSGITQVFRDIQPSECNHKDTKCMHCVGEYEI